MSTGMSFDSELSQRLDRYSILEGADDRTGYSSMLLGGMRHFAPGRQGVTDAEANAWADEQEALRESGAFYFSLGQYFFDVERG